MEKTFNELIQALSSRSTLTGVELPFYRFGEQGFQNLMELVESDKTPSRRTLLYLYILGSLARDVCPNRYSELAKALITLSECQNKAVRSTALVELSRIALLRKRFPKLNITIPDSATLKGVVENAKRLGITSEATQVVDDFVNEL